MPRKKIPLRVIEARHAANAFKPVVPGDSGRRAGTKGPAEIMYIERKAGELTGNAHIGRVTFSKTKRTIYYQGRALQRMERGGFKSNHYDKESGEDYWVSGPKGDGRDRLYGERVPVKIDEDVRAEYWCLIRNQPKRKNEKTA